MDGGVEEAMLLLLLIVALGTHLVFDLFVFPMSFVCNFYTGPLSYFGPWNPDSGPV